MVDAASASFDLADGGRLAFLLMTRTDTFSGSKELKELKIEDATLKNVLDTSSVRTSL